MSTAFVSQGVWPQLTKAARVARTKSDVAVAYFGAGASRLLPLSIGSRLVVDASDQSVGSGQTCPADLIKLLKEGVAIYSVSNLHAKVFVLGSTTYIGSANVSRHSASQLIEALIRTNEPSTVKAARTFVRQHCLHELTPTVLRRLAKLYRPPRFPGGKKERRTQAAMSKQPALPRLFLSQLRHIDWSEKDQALHDVELVVAKKRQEHPRSYRLDSFKLTGKCVYKRGDLVVQVVNEGGDRVLASPPGNVLHVRTRHEKNRQVSFVYLELPARRRRPVKALARTLGQGALKRLGRNSEVRNPAFARALLTAWAN